MVTLMATHRACERYNMLHNGVHTSNLVDFSSETEDKVWGGSAISALLGLDVVLAYAKNCLKDFGECVAQLFKLTS